MNKIGVYYNESALRDIMKSQGITNIEEQIMMEKLSIIKAEFLQRFGFEGSFRTEIVSTNSKRSRMAFKVFAADKRTAAALKTQPGWLGRFI